MLESNILLPFDRQDAGRTAELGVVVAGMHIEGQSVAEFCDNVERFGDEVIAKGGKSWDPRTRSGRRPSCGPSASSVVTEAPS